MERNVVDATNAWRMRRTRGDIDRFRLLAAAVRDAETDGFFAEGLAAAVLPGFALVVEDLGFAEVEEVGVFCGAVEEAGLA